MKTTLYFSSILVSLFLISNNAYAQLNITNFTNKNDVHAIYTDNDTVWIGTSGGIIKQNIDGTIFNIYTTDDGLGSNFITSIAVDNYGNKWFGTINNGVTIFDGINWTIHNEDDGWIDNHVNSIDVDLSGNVWIGSFQGVNKWDGTNLTRYIADNGFITYDVRSVSADGDTIWFGTPDGLFRFFNETWTQYTTTNTGGNLISNDINVVKAKNDSIWIGTNGSGINLFNSYLNFWQSYTATEGLPNTFIMDIALDLSDSPVAATQYGIANFSGASWFDDTYFTGLNCKVVQFDKIGAKWVGYGEIGGGIDMQLGGPSINYSIINELAKNDINDIKSDINGALYVATSGGGLSVYEASIWATFDTFTSSIPSNFVHDIAIEGTTSIWMATSNGIARKDGATWIIYNTSSGLIDNSVTSVDIDQTNLKWFGTANGVSSFDGTNWTNYTTVDGLMTNQINAVTVDANNNIWFLHNLGLSRFDGSNWTLYTLAQIGLTVGELTDIDADENGGVWVATSEGVAWFDGTNWTNYTTANSSLISNNLLSVYVDTQNVKHFGSLSSGISIYDDVNWAQITKYDGLASNLVSAVYFDGNYVWSGGKLGGLSRTYIAPLTVNAYTLPASVCQGSSATLQVDVTGGFGNYAYSWTSNPAGFTSSNPVETIYPNVNTTYYITVTDDFESQTSQTQILVTIVNPSFINGPTNVCNDNTPQPYWVQYNPNITYGWSVEGGSISGDYNEQIDVIWDKGIEFGKIQLTEYDMTVNCSVTQTLEVKMHPNLIGRVLRKGDNLLISLDSGMVYYQWYKNEFAIEGANQQFYVMPVSDRGGFYYVELQSEFNCYAISETITIDNSPGLKLYPNPTVSNLSLEFTNTEIGDGVIQIKDLNGKTILSENFVKPTTDKKLEVNLTKLLPGIYNLDIFLNGKFLYSEKLVKN